MFEAQLQPFVEWKTKKGFHVIEGYTNDPQVGTTTFSIKSYIQGLYNEPDPGVEAPSFVLFVGDINQVPTWTGQAAGHVTDLYYCEYTNDDFPEIYYGRFSAQNASQLQPQIDKTLMYEQYTMPDPTYLNECVMIAGMDASFAQVHGNGQILYGTENYFNESNGLFSHTYLYPESGNNAANIRQNISDGVCYANYTAHGSPSGWANPSFTTSHIPQMTNEGNYALLVGNCCSTSEYQVGECFGEALLRAEDKGSLGYIGASNSTYWDEDYYWGVGVGPITNPPPTYSQTTLGAYDRTFHTNGEPMGDWYTTMDQMVFAGNLAVTQSGSGRTRYYWEAYCLMGDPSLMIYFAEPPAMQVTYQPLLPLGTTTFTINTDEPYSYVAISMDGILHGAMQADGNGTAEMTITPIMNTGTADIVVTSQNKEPYIGTVLVANPDGPYVLLESHSTNELAGNGNNRNEANEVIGLSITLKNWGNTDGTNITATLSTTDQYVTISDDNELCDVVPALSISTFENAFSIIIDPTIPDRHEVGFELVINDPEREIWTSEIKILLSAPEMICNEIVIDDSEEGNGNGRLDPGETADVKYILSNQGGVTAEDVQAVLMAHSSFISIADPAQAIGNISLFVTKTVVFPVTVDTKAPEGIIVPFELELTSFTYVTNEISPIKIGLIYEDFETGDLTKFNWETGGDQVWFVSYTNPFEGNYCLKSQVIDHNQTSEISLQYTSMIDDSITFYRKVSSASGDKLRFYIDSQMMDHWSGTIDGWKRASFPVSAGTHTYKWIYAKDGGGSQGSDAAWIDYINFPPPPASTIYAGQDEIICSGETFQTEAQATNYDSVLWTTSGTGTFDDDKVLNPIYTPSNNDITSGEVALSLSMTDNDGVAFDDEMLLTLTDVPGTPNTASGPDVVDLFTVFTSDYATEAVEEATGYTWLVEPSEAGMLVNRGEAVTIVWNRDWTGTAVVKVTAYNQCGESDPSVGFEITVINGTVGTEELKLTGGSLAVYPNPANSYIWVELQHFFSTVEVNLVSTLGSSVYREEITVNGQHFHKINIENLQAGIYILYIRDRTGLQTRKILIN
jgi:hypothetical protein